MFIFVIKLFDIDDVVADFEVVDILDLMLFKHWIL